MATEPEFTRTENASCTIASEFRRCWQDTANAWTRPRLAASRRAACRTRAVRRGPATDRARAGGGRMIWRTATMTEPTTAAQTQPNQTVRELRELIAALDHRVPHMERAGEVSIARA